MTPTLSTDVSSLPPEGAVPPKGGLSAELVTPTLSTDVSSLPPEGAVPPKDHVQNSPPVSSTRARKLQALMA